MSEVKWRDLAMQFDGHRMEAISLLKMIINDAPDDQYLSVRNFLKAAPLSGEDVLRNRIEEIAENMHQQLTATTNSLTNAQEALKSAGIEADTVQAGVMELKDKLTFVREQRDSELIRNAELEAKMTFKEDLTAQIVELQKELVEAAGRNIALREERNTLVAENAALNEVISAVRGVARNSEGIAGWHLNGNIAGWDEILPEIDDVETPATEAYLNAVRAELVPDKWYFQLTFDIPNLDGMTPYQAHGAAWEQCRVAIMRNIEVIGNAGKDGV